MAVGRGNRCCRRLSPDAGASVSAMAPFPTAAHRTGRADFPHPALGRESQQGMHRPSRTSRLFAREPCASCLALPSSFFQQTLDNRVLALRQCPILVTFRSAPEPRTRAPSLHRSYPVSSVPWALRLPHRPEADHLRSPRLVAATHHLCGSHTLPQRPSAAC